MRRRGLMFGIGVSDDNWWENYMTVEAVRGGLRVGCSGMPDGCILEYSLDGKKWTTLSDGEYTPAINDAGEKIAFRGNGINYVKGTNGIGTFAMNNNCNLLGNCMSLLYGDNAAEYNSVPAYAFYSLFNGCSNIISVADNFLPATELNSYCYYNMFYNCTKLSKAPALPATTLSSSCYARMFRGCTSLQVSPVLPAESLLSSCYAYMFNSCSKLSYIKMLARNVNISTSLTQWVYNVASSGTFVKNANATWDVTGINGVPSGWTVEYDVSTDGISDATFTLDGKTWHFNQHTMWRDIIERYPAHFSYADNSSQHVLYITDTATYYIKTSKYAYIPRQSQVENGEAYKLEKITE